MLQINEIHQGDCLILMQDIDSNTIDLLFTDLPYGTTKAKFDIPIDLDLFWKQVDRITKPNACIALWSQQPFTTDLINSNRKHFKYEWIIEKGRATGHLNAKKRPMKAHESILIFYKKSPTYNPQKTYGHPRKISLAKHKLNCKDTVNYNNNTKLTSYDSTERYPRSVLKFSWPAQNYSKHPQEKPVSACEYIIKTYSNEGDLVFDCTSGSGTICVAAQNTGRSFIGIELDKEIHSIAYARVIENALSLNKPIASSKQ